MIKKCEECGGEFKTEKKYVNRGHGRFCSTKCAAKFGNKNRTKSSTKVNCSTCDKELNRRKSDIERSRNFFCNRKCKQKFEFNGNERNKRKGNIRRAHFKQKEKLLEKHGVRCQFPDCALKLYNNRKLIDMHHFGDPLNHSKTKLLCTYHHRLADNGYIEIKSNKILIKETE